MFDHCWEWELEWEGQSNHEHQRRVWMVSGMANMPGTTRSRMSKNDQQCSLNSTQQPTSHTSVVTKMAAVEKSCRSASNTRPVTAGNLHSPPSQNLSAALLSHRCSEFFSILKTHDVKATSLGFVSSMTRFLGPCKLELKLKRALDFTSVSFALVRVQQSCRRAKPGLGPSVILVACRPRSAGLTDCEPVSSESNRRAMEGATGDGIERESFFKRPWLRAFVVHLGSRKATEASRNESTGSSLPRVCLQQRLHYLEPNPNERSD
ncbi:hypothetical protein MPTK1_1g27540 [Marchantia polymorpha subsp. ruderalis]|uniref:Uncharacterized protein n=2 Tax=Marchantia polymorpha TaxID=3197 RepID=A0AAF6AUW5_MARPO|nr:hypothetical protein MARPO_0002s0124 [Marchantia polymorpha]BBN00236.1 hypothetical protein Mp_1g27540 [Marchantia polymorpha subsp. ruderalis]|eukprot:PTQ49648.1 hypothetical protein MARPO_0002s0124 [Marchantia polymorpha]